MTTTDKFELPSWSTPVKQMKSAERGRKYLKEVVMSDNIYPDGLFVAPPRDGAPEFVKARISIKKTAFLAFLDAYPDEWMNIDVKSGREGKWYSQLNTWKPEGQPATAPKKAKVDRGPDPDDKLPAW